MKATRWGGLIVLLVTIALVLGACASTDGGAPASPAMTALSQTVLPKPDAPMKKHVNSLGMEFVWIPPGEFLLGSPETEAERRPNEAEHRVVFANGYYIQTTEVTQGQWKKVMNTNPSFFADCGDDCPVENVSWDDVQAFVARLNDLLGAAVYRLPTEAEWEYACRSGTQTPFAFGRCLSTDQANYNDSRPEKAYSGCTGSGVARRRTLPVASLAHNAWGIYDMHGNVWEWCSDWMGDYPSQPSLDPTGPESGEKKIYRGGGQNDSAGYCRSALRGQFLPDRKSGSLGFRLAMSRSPSS